RLRDLRDLFLDTGMGSHAYSLIERGMVDNVLSDESGHRRFLFEEAAGIMRYKTRKKEALQKLDLTLADLTRVNDVVTEIEREVRSLARQVGKARRFNRLREEIKTLDLGLAKEDLERLAGTGGALQEQRGKAEDRRGAIAGILARHEAELEQLKLELPQLEERREALRQRKQLSLDLFQTRVKQQSAAENWAAKQAELTQKKGQLLAESAGMEREEQELADSLAAIGRAADSSIAEVERARARVESETRAVAEIEEQIRLHDESEKRAREDFAALESRRATLRELKDRYEGYDESVRSLLAGPTRAARILGTVGDVLHASGDWLAALEASLGEAVQFIVAERTDAALKALKALESGGGGRATFIALDRLSWARAAEVPEKVLGAPGVHG